MPRPLRSPPFIDTGSGGSEELASIYIVHIVDEKAVLRIFPLLNNIEILSSLPFQSLTISSSAS